MIDLLFCIPICAILACILIQDYRERMVYAVLYLFLGILVFAFQAYRTAALTAIVNAVFNLSVVLLMFGTCFLYARIRLKKQLKDVLGIGDMMFFCASALMFATVSFLVLLVFSLLFALLLHLMFKKKQAFGTVPLAGYLALFYLGVYASGMFVNTNFLYAF